MHILNSTDLFYAFHQGKTMFIAMGDGSHSEWYIRSIERESGIKGHSYNLKLQSVHRHETINHYMCFAK